MRHRRLAVPARLVPALALLIISSAPLSAAPPVAVVAGDAEAPRPQLVQLGPTLLQVSALLAARLELSDAFAADADGGTLDAGTHANLLARVGLAWSSFDAARPWVLGANLELDAFSGLATDAPTLEGDGIPNSAGSRTAVLRKANLLVSYNGVVTLQAGVMTSHWGLGLIANDGAHGWTPGGATFTDPRGGDRVLRGQLAVKTPGEVSVGAAVAADHVLGDDSLLPGDSANQLVLALFAEGPAARAGLYGVARVQDTRDDKSIHAYVVDAFGEGHVDLSARLRLTLGAEAAAIFGTTTLAPSTDHPEHDLLQIGAVLRAGLATSDFGGVLDVVFASGDGNLDDGAQNAFKADPNFSQGLVLFPYVVAAQTSRSAYNAVNPDLSGYPPEDLERLPTRGSVSNTVALFPRLWLRPLTGLEVYGGLLFAFANAAPSDPLNTRLAGGAPRNARDVAPGDYLGTELDLGVRYRMLAWGSELNLGLEGGVLLPGGAIDTTGVDRGQSVGAFRAMLAWKL